MFSHECYLVQFSSLLPPKHLRTKDWCVSWSEKCPLAGPLSCFLTVLYITLSLEGPWDSPHLCPLPVDWCFCREKRPVLSTRPPATQPRPQQRCMCCSFFLSHSAGLREAAGQDGRSPSPYRNLTYCGVPPSPFKDSSLNPTCTQDGVEDGSCSAPGNFLLENLSCHHSISRILPFQALTGLPFKTVYVLVYNLASRDPSPWEFLY